LKKGVVNRKDRFSVSHPKLGVRPYAVAPAVNFVDPLCSSYQRRLFKRPENREISTCNTKVDRAEKFDASSGCILRPKEGTSTQSWIKRYSACIRTCVNQCVMIE